MVGLWLDTVDWMVCVKADHQYQQNGHIHEIAQTLLGEGKHNLYHKVPLITKNENNLSQDQALQFKAMLNTECLLIL